MADEKSDEKTFYILPQELFEQAASYSLLTFNDLYHLTLVCRKFKDALDSNALWKIKIFQRWPSLENRLNNGWSGDWKEQCRLRVVCGRYVWQQVSSMSRLCFDKEELPKEACKGLFEEIDRHEHGFIFVVDELLHILNGTDSKKNLTHKYYAERALRLIQHHFLKSALCKYNELPPTQQHIEQGATLIACWCQPTEDYAATVTEVYQQIDDIAVMVRTEISNRSSKHPAGEVLPKDRINDLQNSVWSSSEVRLILESLNHVLFNQLGFLPNRTNYYDVNNSYINQVLKQMTGIPISLSVVYMAVARRLGVVCEPVNFPQHFLLKWKEHEDLGKQEAHTFIDVFQKGKFLDENGCRNIVAGSFFPVENESFKAISTKQVLQRMIRNLYGIAREQGSMGDGVQFLCDTLQLTILLDQDNIQARLNLAKLYLNLDVNLDEAENLLAPLDNTDSEPQRLIRYLREAVRSQRADSTSPRQIKPKKRSEFPGVEFSLGLIMKHKKYHYQCVVYGWDKECRASQEWIHHMGVHNLPRGQWQPFYNVLVEDGSNRYAAQENLLYTDDPNEITHPQTGKYFNEYCDTHYIPNDVKQEEYPEDWECSMKYVREHYSEAATTDNVSDSCKSLCDEL